MMESKPLLATFVFLKLGNEYSFRKHGRRMEPVLIAQDTEVSMEGVVPVLIEKVTNEFYQSSSSEDMQEPSETELSSKTDSVGDSEEVTIERKTAPQPSKSKLDPDSGTGGETRKPVAEGQTTDAQAAEGAEATPEGEKAEEVLLNKESGASSSPKVVPMETSGPLAPGSGLRGEKGRKSESTTIDRRGSQRESASVKPSTNTVPTIARLPVLKEAAKVTVALEDEQGSKTPAAKLTAAEPQVLFARPSQARSGEKAKDAHSIPAVVDLTESPEKQKESGEKVNAFGALAAGQPANVTFIDLVEESGKTQELTPLVPGGVKFPMQLPVQQWGKRLWTSQWKPLNPATLEKVGLDSKGFLYWYDGGRNMYQSPPSADPTYLPSESELQLVCKSMVQWTAKLKELRGSMAEVDSKLAQIIKDQFISRVRVATQRKPKDPVFVQKLIAASQIRQVPSSPFIPQPNTSASLEIEKTTAVVQPTFPQGSILVVPHPHHPFHAVPVLPVFANTAVIMPQNAAQQAVGIETRVSTAVTVPDKDKEGVSASSAVTTASVIQSSVTNISTKDNSDLKPQVVGKDGTTVVSAAPQAVITPMSQMKPDSRQMIATLRGFPLSTVAFAMKVADPVQLATIDFESKSIEITGEVPIRKLELTPDGEVSIANEGRLPKEGKSKEEQQNDHSAADKEKAHLRSASTSSMKENEDGSAGPLQGRTSQEVLSAKMLLSLTGRAKDWPISPLDKEPPRTLTENEQALKGTTTPQLQASSTSLASSPMSGSAPLTPSGRKRKQKPTPSAKVSDFSVAADVGSEKSTPPRGKRGRKPKQQASEGDSGANKSASSAKGTPKRSGKGSKKQQLKGGSESGKSREFTAEELLAILDIPPASDAQTKDKPPAVKGKVKGASSRSTASVKLQQLKAERGAKPVKEFVIETDSESGSDSSSGSGSSSFSPDSGSSSDSSSDSSSEAQPSEPKPPEKPTHATRGGRGGRGRRRGRGRGRGGATVGGREQRTKSASSEESSSDEEEDKVKPVVQRGRGRGRGGRRARGHIVSIPTNILSAHPRKRKATHRESDVDLESEKALSARKAMDIAPDTPVDLSSFYTTKGVVDLGTLSEITKSVQETTGTEVNATQSRSKRTCVRVREEMHKLREILEDDVKPAPVPRPRGRGRGRGTTVSGKGSDHDTSYQEVAVVPKKYRRPARSQFTHKRRKKRKKQPEEEALWQPARKQAPGESLKPLYVFSTYLANKAAEAVLRGRHSNIIQFHHDQPKGPGFLRLPQDQAPKLQDGETSRSRKATETTDSEEVLPRAPKRRSARLSTGDSTQVLKKLRSSTRKAGESEEAQSPPPPPVLRSSRRLRNRQKDSSMSSPVSSPTTSHGSPTPQRLRTRSQSGESSQRASRSSARRASSPDTSARGSLDDKEAIMEEDELEDETKKSPITNQISKEHDGEFPMQQTAGKGPDWPQISPALRSPQENEQTSVPPSVPRDDDDNYTICHGTPMNKSPHDISSPTSAKGKWQQKHSQVPRSAESPSAAQATYPGVPPQASPGSTSELGQRLLSPHSREGGMHIQHFPHEQHREPHWGAANLASQFPGVPGAYPSVYNPGLHPMHYPHGQPMPGANYPYPMPYAWGHHPAHHMHHAHRMQEPLPHQVSQAADMLHHPRSADHHHHHHHHLSHHQLGHTPQASATQSWASQQHAPSTLAYASAKDTLSAYPEKLPLGNAQALPPLHQLHAHSAQPSLSHQVPHSFVRPPHALAPEHMPPGASTPPHAFPYAFEPGVASLSQMHMWQQSQMQPPQIRPIAGMHPSHLPHHLPHHPGMWYSHMSHLMPTGEPPGGSDPSKLGKKSSKGAKAPMEGGETQSKLSSNRNANSNNNISVSRDVTTLQHNLPGQHPWYVTQYQVQAFPERQPSSTSFSIEHLAESQQRSVSESTQQSRIARGSTWVPPMVSEFRSLGASINPQLQSGSHSQQGTLQGTGQAAVTSPLQGQGRPILAPQRQAGQAEGTPEEQDLSTSAILERTRKSNELADVEGDCIVSSIGSFPS